MSVYRYVVKLLRAADMDDVIRRTGYTRHYLWRIKTERARPGSPRLDRLLDVLDAKIIQKVKEGK